MSSTPSDYPSISFLVWADNADDEVWEELDDDARR